MMHGFNPFAAVLLKIVGNGCIHEWSADPVKPRHWVCDYYGGKRWWREFPNGRGDARLGIVLHKYKGEC